LATGAVNTISNVAGLLFKAKEGEVRANDNPRAIQSQLGNGESLDGTLQSRMSSAFGYDFSSVRVHKDNQAARLSSDLNARAFTIGSRVAFGANEYQPGTLVGDALIAHELAHVVQQGGASAQAPLQKGESETGALEDDADVSAVRAVASLWSGVKTGLANVGKNSIPALKSGLKLRRCESKKTSPTPLKAAGDPKDYATFGDWLKSFPSYPGHGEDVDVTSLAPAELRNYISGAIGPIPDCADVSILLRHVYLKAHHQSLKFKAGPGKGEDFTIGFGVPDKEVARCETELGSITFQEDRKEFNLANFYKKAEKNVTNLKQLLDAGLQSGDLFVWKRLPSIPSTSFQGHVQTVQNIDMAGGTITFLEGNMHAGKPAGVLEERLRSFTALTGKADGDADILPAPEEFFFGAGPWVA